MSRISIEAIARSEFENSGTVLNMLGDSNYGIYSTMEGLSRVMLECTFVCKYIQKRGL